MTWDVSIYGILQSRAKREAVLSVGTWLVLHDSLLGEKNKLQTRHKKAQNLCPTPQKTMPCIFKGGSLCVFKCMKKELERNTPGVKHELYINKSVVYIKEPGISLYPSMGD